VGSEIANAVRRALDPGRLARLDAAAARLRVFGQALESLSAAATSQLNKGARHGD
jgi:hypothetical protein